MNWKTKALLLFSIALLILLLWPVFTQDFVESGNLIMMGIEYDETRRTWVRATPSTIRSGAWSHVYLDQKVTVRDVGANCRTVKRLIGEADNQVMIDVITCQEPEEGEWFQIK